MEYKRQGRFEIRLSIQEKERIVNNSSKLGISTSEFLRLCALNKNIQPLVNKDLITSINRIGANINQILRVLNSNSKALSVYANLPAEIEELKNLMLEVREMYKANIKGK